VGVNFVRDALMNPSAMTAIDNWAEVTWSGRVIRTMAMVARFDQVADVTLDELRIELMYTADETAERLFADHAY
jgi:hypothetical protein